MNSPREEVASLVNTLGEIAGSAARRRPKAALAVAAALGVVLGADRGQRRDLLDRLGGGSR